MDSEVFKTDEHTEDYIIIGNSKVPKPYYGDLVSGETYYIVSLHTKYHYKPVVCNRHMSPTLPVHQEHGLLHKTKRGAANHGHALVRFTSRRSGR